MTRSTLPSAESGARSNVSTTGRRRTSQFKLVPDEFGQREAIRQQCQRLADRLDRSGTLTQDETEAHARAVLEQLGLPEGYLGWTMVLLTSAFWRDQVASVPPERRLLLLPHCLKHAEGCPADYDEFGLDCEKCGACSIADFRGQAEQMGYRVLVAEGSPIVLKIIVSGYVDAIVGVACLNVLEKAFDKLLMAGIPCMAVPLLSSDCRNTSVDEAWVREMIELRQPAPTVQTRTYLHLMRAANGLFETDELQRLTGKDSATLGRKDSHPDPVTATETLALDYVGRGGKYARPLITLAVHDALTGGHGTSADGAAHLAALPDGVRRAALSVEVFHKASLVHDDIEDDDGYRYGAPTLHRQHGIPTAINVGDYLIGLGYRLASKDRETLGGTTAAEILSTLADAHLRLSAGQGAELAWREQADKSLAPLDALKIYALKTAPAFEAALLVGARLAGEVESYRPGFRKFAQHLGIAFQILNDLKDWQPDSDNKLDVGSDLLGARPTVLWALALEHLGPDREHELRDLATGAMPAPEAIGQAREIYQAAQVFDKARRLVDKYQARAEAIAAEIEPVELQRLLYYLVETVLERPAEPSPALVTPSIPAELSVNAGTS